jgi:uncharacterized glyoxalase superfamily protein PhnB
MKLTGLTPMLESDDLKGTIRFYEEFLGFECVGAFPDADDPQWAALRRDGIEIMFSARNAHSKIEKTVMTGSLYFNPDDVDEIWDQLKDKVTIEYPIENFPYGMREFAIRDCNGYILQFGQESGEG